MKFFNPKIGPIITLFQFVFINRQIEPHFLAFVNAPMCLLSDIEEIGEFGDNRTPPRVTALPEFVVDYVKIAPGAICIPQKEITSDYFAVIIPLKE